jgi:hypothetical protein
MGGTGGYLVTLSGAKRLLEFIDERGMTNGIDTVQQNAADVMNVFYATPHLIYSECFRGDNNPDTDIQHDYHSLEKSLFDRIADELVFHGGGECIRDVGAAMEMARTARAPKGRVWYFWSADILQVDAVAKACVDPCYKLDANVVVVVPGGHPDRYFSRLKKGMSEEYNISDAIVCV